MKYKTQDVEERNKIDAALIDMLQLEWNKISLLTSVKHYCKMNGFMDYKKFLGEIFKLCSKLKWSLEEVLLGREIEIPEFTIPKFKTFESIEEAFDSLAEIEDECFDKLMNVATMALEEKDPCAVSFLMPAIAESSSHILCSAAEAVKNGQDPNKLLCGQHSTAN